MSTNKEKLPSLAQDWLDNYYPTKADDPEVIQNWRTALEHSLTKWKGLRPSVLASYDLEINSTRVAHRRTGKEVLEINGHSCSLCQKASIENPDNLCLVCPLYKQRDNTSCDEITDQERAKDNPSCAPYGSFSLNDNPEPMIALLETTLANLSQDD